MRSREELAYAAGLFEGEGCFSAQWRRSRTAPGALMISIEMTDREPLDCFVEALGFGKIIEPRGQRAARWRPVYRVNLCSFEEAQAALALMWTWLGPRRRARATEIARAYTSGAAWLRKGKAGNAAPGALRVRGRFAQQITREPVPA